MGFASHILHQICLNTVPEGTVYTCWRELSPAFSEAESNIGPDLHDKSNVRPGSAQQMLYWAIPENIHTPPMDDIGNTVRNAQ